MTTKTPKATIDTEWTYPEDKITLDDISRDKSVCVPGMLVEVRGADGKEMVLIGHVNDLLGQCNDCSIDESLSVIRYRRVWVP